MDLVCGRIEMAFSWIVVENVWYRFKIFVEIRSSLDGSGFRLIILEEAMNCSIDNENII